MKKAIIFDRDGTLIIDKIYLNDPAQIVYLPNVFQALQMLRDLDFIFAVATNQSGIAKGIVSVENMNLIHEKISQEFAKHKVSFAGFYHAPYATDSNHPRRKPNPGMLLDASSDHGIDLKQSWMIGDRMTDVEAGHRAGCRSIFLTGVETPEQSPFAPPEFVANDLLEAAEWIKKTILN